MLSCFILEFKNNDKEKSYRFFIKRIREPKYSKMWKLVFVSLKYIHVIVLGLLFAYGCSNLNNFKNLGYMLFFCFYTAYETLYRKTCWILIVFISIFIVGQYYYSLFYKISLFDNNEFHANRLEDLKTLEWYSFIPLGCKLWDPYNINAAKSIHFRLNP